MGEKWSLTLQLKPKGWRLYVWFALNLKGQHHNKDCSFSSCSWPQLLLAYCRRKWQLFQLIELSCEGLSLALSAVPDRNTERDGSFPFWKSRECDSLKGFELSLLLTESFSSLWVQMSSLSTKLPWEACPLLLAPLPPPHLFPCVCLASKKGFIAGASGHTFKTPKSQGKSYPNSHCADPCRVASTCIEEGCSQTWRSMLLSFAKSEQWRPQIISWVLSEMGSEKQPLEVCIVVMIPGRVTHSHIPWYCFFWSFGFLSVPSLLPRFDNCFSVWTWEIICFYETLLCSQNWLLSPVHWKLHVYIVHLRA